MQNFDRSGWPRCRNIVVPYTQRLRHPFLQEIDYGLRVFPNALKGIEGDLLISPYYDFFIPSSFISKTIITVHDLCYWDLSDKYRWYTKVFPHFVLPRSLKRCAAVITVSQFSKSRLNALFGEAIAGKSIELVYNTFKIRKNLQTDIDSRVETLKRKIGAESGTRYLLYSGGIENRKNIENMLASFRDLANENSTKLIMTGNCEAHPKIIQLLSTYELKEKVLLTGILSLDEMDLLYSNVCDGAMNLSLYEGFGRNTCEAILFGLPILCSDIPINREVGGNYPIYCDPHDVHDIYENMQRLVLQGRRFPATEVDPRFQFETNERKFIKLIESILQ